MSLPAESSGTGKPLEACGFDQDPLLFRAALQYVEEGASTWILNPAMVPVEQPDNQGVIAENLGTFLRDGPNGDRLSEMSQSNVLGLKIGVVYGVSPHQLRINADPHAPDACTEYMSDPYETNTLLTGILELTGATALRDDIADGNEGGARVHKGMFNSEPVYFEERVVHLTDRDSDMLPFARSVWVLSESGARAALDRLSDQDRAVFRALGLEASNDEFGNITHGRTRMIGMMRLYAAYYALTDGGLPQNTPSDKIEPNDRK